MLDSETLKKLENASIEDRIKTIKIILNSLKNEIKKTSKKTSKSFRVRAYNLGQNITVDREEIYGERNQ
ncbi:MAG: hypothetical protein QNJ64_21530 [Crocosphaera sp.]|nr:hypothetical protein [Crocosphaera sp.]